MEQTVNEYKASAAQKMAFNNPEAECECNKKMDEILSLIASHERNILVRENVREIEQVKDGERVIVIYREDNCEEDWREWKARWEQSEKRITQLNAEIERLYQDQNEFVIERSSFLEQQSLLEVQIRNLKSQISQFSSVSQNNNSRVSELESEKERLFHNKQELLQANSSLKAEIINLEVKEKSSMSRISILEQQLQDSKKNYELMSEWRKSH